MYLYQRALEHEITLLYNLEQRVFGGRIRLIIYNRSSNEPIL